MWFDSMDVTDKLEDVYDELILLTDGETDSERREYNEYLLNSIRQAIEYINLLEKEIRGNNDHKKI